MIIENLSNPGADPKNGDLIEYTYPSGTKERKTFFKIVPDIEPEPERVLTRYEFMCLFTSAEMIGIMAASDSDPAVRLFLKQLDNVENVKFSDKNTMASLAYLVSKGLITEERKAQIEAFTEPEA